MSNLTDAAGRPINIGDTAGGTSSGRYQATILGPIVALGADKAKVRVTNHATIGTLRPENGDEVWISASRVFRVAPHAERRFVGFKTPDGVLWTVSPRFKKPLYEAAHITERFTPDRLRSTYRGALEPLWENPADLLQP